MANRKNLNGILVIATLCSLLFLPSCNWGHHTGHNSNNEGNSESTAENVTLSGTSACSDVSGVVTLNFDSSADSTVSGTVVYNGTTYDLAGFFDADTGAVTASYSDADIQYTLDRKSVV